MQEEHRKAIQRNFVSLVEQTDLDLMVSALYEKGVFSEQMIEPYKDTNKEVRVRKRQLYVDVMRRGPEAFDHLLDALSEAGYWDLVRDLDPNSSLHTCQPRKPLPSTSRKSNENYVSLSKKSLKKSKTGVEASKNLPSEPPPVPPSMDMPDPSKIPQFHVVKSTRFMEDNGGDLKLYRTRGRNRGVLVVFSYIEFPNNMEPYRYGVDVDCSNLKYLFDELGFKVLSYINLTRSETLDTLKFLKQVIVDTECVFIVVSSHGYELTGSSDNDIRCCDGKLIRISEIVEHFNNKNFPALRNIPKVFIFQLCRGSNEDYLALPSSGWQAGRAVADGQARAARRARAGPAARAHLLRHTHRALHAAGQRVVPRQHGGLVVHPGAVLGVRGARARLPRGEAVHARGPAAARALPHPDLVRGPLGVQQPPLPTPRPLRDARPPRAIITQHWKLLIGLLHYT